MYIKKGLKKSYKIDGKVFQEVKDIEAFYGKSNRTVHKWIKQRRTTDGARIIVRTEIS